ncbi:hypothetical protein Hanom_Chr06g00572571 [Helianthus anomalus]
MIQGHMEIHGENVLFTSGGDDSGILKVAPDSGKTKSTPIISKTSANVFTTGMLEEASVVPNVPEPPMSQENLETVLENVFKACKKNPVEEKLDLLLSEIKGQRVEMKTLSESVEFIKAQTERNIEALKALQKENIKGTRNQHFSIRNSKNFHRNGDNQNTNYKCCGVEQSSSSNKVLEEITILRAGNNSITDALEKLIKEWVALQEKNQTEFAEIHESVANNTKLVEEVQSLMKTMHFNIARLAKLETKEIMKALPVEQSHQELPKSTPQQSTAIPIAEAGTTVMGPPLAVPKEEMLKRLASFMPLVISNLNLKTSQTGPKPTLFGDTVISTRINQQAMKDWEEEADSRQAQIVKRKISETQSNRYTLLREDGAEEKGTDGDLADKLHALDILSMKDYCEKEKGNTQFIRRALTSISKVGIKLFERIAFSDFDLCINCDYVYNKKVYLTAPDTTIPSELIEEARSGDIIELPMIKDRHNYSVVYRDSEKNKALFRSVDICKYSKQTLRFTMKCMNRKQEQLQKK